MGGEIGKVGREKCLPSLGLKSLAVAAPAVLPAPAGGGENGTRREEEAGSRGCSHPVALDHATVHPPLPCKILDQVLQAACYKILQYH